MKVLLTLQYLVLINSTIITLSKCCNKTMSDKIRITLNNAQNNIINKKITERLLIKHKLTNLHFLQGSSFF